MKDFWSEPLARIRNIRPNINISRPDISCPTVSCPTPSVRCPKVKCPEIRRPKWPAWPGRCASAVTGAVRRRYNRWKCAKKNSDLDERLPPWLTLLAEFSSRTTLHGVKYLFLPCRFEIRRIIWITIWMTNCGLLFYIVTSNAIKLHTYPVNIQVQVIYTDTMPFAAITICNQNMYRLTALQRHGLYDLVVNDGGGRNRYSASDGSNACEDYTFYTGICRLPDEFVTGSKAKYYVQLSEVTRDVCMRLCSDVYSLDCSGVLYNRRDRSCALTPYTGDWYLGSYSECNSSANGLEFYHRKRCTVETEILCNFEDDKCSLMNVTSERDQWIITEARQHTIDVDNTLNLATGHFINLLLTELRPGYTARIVSPYINTTGKCLELFYWLLSDPSGLSTSSSSMATVSVILITQENDEITVASKNKGPKDWSPLFVSLPDGLHQIVIQGQRGLYGMSGAAVDDITLQSCAKFSRTRECRVTRLGKDYMGMRNVTVSGQPCLRWATLNSPIVSLLPDSSILDAQNYCRYISRVGWTGPSCFVQPPNSDVPVAMPCNVPFCDCHDNTSYFRCGSGLCLAQSLVCNGIDDCLDGSDEREPCASKINIECDFNDDYICGYKSSKVGVQQWTRSTYNSGSFNINPNVSAFDQMMLLSSQLGQEGDQVELLSPLWTFEEPTEISFRYIVMGQNVSSTSSSDSVMALSIYEYTPLHVPRRLLFQEKYFAVSRWKTETVCMPAGTYQLMFLGTQGHPYDLDFGIDSIEIVGSCSDVVPLPSESFSCTFTSMCGYHFTSNSAFFTLSLIYTKNALDYTDYSNICGQTFAGLHRTIVSPGFPNNYPNNLNCSFSIEEPISSIITITFVEFAVEPESDCLYDHLQIMDPASGVTKIYCGETRPPAFVSKGNVLYLSFVTDSQVTNAGFKLVYSTNVILPTDYTSVLRYGRPSHAVLDFSYTSRLISPPVVLSSAACVRVIFMAEAALTVTMGYVNSINESYAERTLHRTVQPVGSVWHQLYLDIDETAGYRFGREMLILFETEAMQDATVSAMIADVALINRTCAVNVPSPSFECNFSDIDQCGYLDKSPTDVGWTRVYSPLVDEYYMRAEFLCSDIGVAVLRSPVVVISQPQCLDILYYVSSSGLHLEVVSVSSAGSSGSINESLLAVGNGRFFASLMPGTYAIELKAFQLTDFGSAVLPGSLSTLKVYSLAVSNGPCINTDTVANATCNFEDTFICNYDVQTSLGLTWIWARFDSIVPAGYANSSTGHVMMFNGSTTPQPLNAVMTSPLIHIVSTTTGRTLELHAFASTNGTLLSVYLIGELGRLSRRLLTVQPPTTLSWFNISLCLPPGDYKLAFVADAGTARGFIAIDDVVMTNASCLPTPPTECTDPDLSNCVDLFYISSTSFMWTYTSDIRDDTVVPAGSACVRVLYAMDDMIVYNETSKPGVNQAECDIYIKGVAQFDVELTFEIFEYRNCSNQYIQIWSYSGSNFTNQNDRRWCSELGRPASNKIVVSTNKVVQLHVTASNSYPRFVLRYRMIPNNLTGYAMSLHYIGQKSSGSPMTQATGINLSNVAVWASAIQYTIASSVCLSMDIAFNSGMFQVSLLQMKAVGDVARETPVFQSTGFADGGRLEWTRLRINVPLNLAPTGRFQFVATLSLVNASFSVQTQQSLVAAFNNIYLRTGSCSASDASLQLNTVYGFDGLEYRDFSDMSPGSSRWYIVSKRSSYSTSGFCKTSLTGSEYSGTMNRTLSGRVCQRWDSQTPHAHMQDNAEFFVDQTLADASNYCRNPTNPFILRSSWCYTVDVDQRREYCDVPYCLDYYTLVEFNGTSIDRAVLASPRIPFSSPSCLSFAFTLTSIVVSLDVALKTSDMTAQQVYWSDNSQTSSDSTTEGPINIGGISWYVGHVSLPAGTRQIFFIADKNDVVSVNQFAGLDNVTVTAGPCPVTDNQSSSQSSTTENRIPYTGPRESRHSYAQLVFDEMEQDGLDIYSLTNELAHQEAQLINSCEYGAAPCPETSFTTEMTDMGQCYTFNFNSSDILVANYTGAVFGAHLVLNIERYEFITGYSSGAGVKIQLRDQNEISTMKDLGIAASPGTHTLVAVSNSQSDSLSPPYGACGVADLQYYDVSDPTQYTESKCRRELATKYVEERCNCKDIEMEGPSPFCPLDTYFNCILPITDSVGTVSNTDNCPSSCHISTYSVELSSAQLSELNKAELFGNNSDDIHNRYIDALETRNRVDANLILATLNQLSAIIQQHRQLKDYLYFVFYDSGTSVAARVESAVHRIADLAVNDIVVNGGKFLGEFEAAYSSLLYPSITYIVDQITRTYSSLAACNDLLRGLQSGAWNANISSWYVDVLSETDRQLTYAGHMLNMFSATFTLNNDKLPINQMRGPCQANKTLITDGIVGLQSDIERVIAEVHDANVSGSFAADTVTEATMEIVWRTLVALQNFMTCSTEYSGFLQQLRTWINSLDFTLRTYSGATNAERALIQLNDNEIWLHDIRTKYMRNEMRKTQLAELVLGRRMTSVLQSTDNSLVDISEQVVVQVEGTIDDMEKLIMQTYLQFLVYLVRLDVFTGNTEVSKFARSLQIWRKPFPNLEVPEILQFSLSEDQTWQVWLDEMSIGEFVRSSAASRLTLVASDYFDLLHRDISDAMVEARRLQAQLGSSIDLLTAAMHDYAASTQLNEAFATQNFLMMDIYYGELKYESTSQSPGYLYYNFFSDLGSYLGLLMGCSSLTMVEIVDLFFYHAIVKLIEHIQYRPRKRVVIDIDLNSSYGDVEPGTYAIEDALEEGGKPPDPNNENVLQQSEA